MATPTYYYIRPTNGTDLAGTNGTSHATAWQTIAYAKTRIVRNPTDGDQINLCDEAEHTVSIATGWPASTSIAPTVIRGYTTVANDGGVGIVSGGGTSGIYSSTSSTVIGVILKDLKLYNCGNANIVNHTGNHLHAENVWFDTSRGQAIASGIAAILNCRFENIGNYTIHFSGGLVAGCYFKDNADVDTSYQTYAFIYHSAGTASLTAINNIFIQSYDSSAHMVGGSTSSAVDITIAHNSYINNYITGPVTGNTIQFFSEGGSTSLKIYDNLFDSSYRIIAIGSPINSPIPTNSGQIIAGNSYYNEQEAPILGDCLVAYSNESLSESPFAKVGSYEFENRHNYFQPVNTGSVFAPVSSNLSARGAIQVVPGGSVQSGNTLAHYKLQDNEATTTVVDSGPDPVNLDAELSGSTTADKRVTGPTLRVPFALDFAAVDATLIEDTAFVSASTLSITFWAKRPNTSAADYIVGKDDESDYWRFESGSHSIRMFTDGGNDGTIAPGVTTTDWHHYAVTLLTRGTALLYVDAVAVGTIDGVTGSGWQFNMIGGSSLGSGRLKMANLKIYNIVLSPSQILADFTEDLS